MSLFGGIIAGAMQGVGDAGQQIAQQNIKTIDEQNLLQQRANLETQKAEALAQFNSDLQNAPLNRLSQSAQQFSQQDVPITAAPVTVSTGNDPGSAGFNPDGSATTGLVGMTRAQVAAYNDPDMLAQFDRQIASDNQSAQAAVAGQTRKMTPDEAIAAAVAKSKLDDLPAYIASKGLATDKYMKLGEGDTLFDTTTGKSVLSNTSKADRTLQLEREKEQGLNQRAQLDRESKEKIADLQDRDPQFIKELKNLYQEGSPEYNAALSARIGKESGVNGGAGGRAVVFNARIIGAGNQALHAIQNIVDLPMGSTTGWLGGYQPGNSLLGATQSILKNNLNPQDVQTYNVMKLGLSRSLATMESQGLSPPGSLTASLDKMDFSTGDTGMTTLRKIAEAKQIAVSALEQKLNDPSVPTEQRGFVQNLIDGFNKAVPYNHSDLTKLEKAQNKNPTLTFTDFASGKLNQNSPATVSSSLPPGFVLDQ